MDIQDIESKIKRTFPNVSQWTPRGCHWKGRTILLGYKAIINGIDCYVFLGRNGLGRQLNHQSTIVPIYCEVAVVGGGSIEETLKNSFVFRLLPEYKRKNSYYRYSSFAENELESAGQKMIDVLFLL